MPIRPRLSTDAGAIRYFSPNAAFDAATLKMAFGAIALNAAGRTGEASPGVTLDSLLDGESEIAVGGGRDRSSVIN
jgi:hypothetical protein